MARWICCILFFASIPMGAAWQLETVDNSPGSGTRNSIVLEENENIHIAYFQQSYQELRYAHKNGSNWIITTIDSNLGSWGGFVSIALDQDNKPHIIYLDYTVESLKYAFLNDNEWFIEIVDTAGVGAISLVMDDMDSPHVSYYDPINLDLKYASKTGSGWWVEVVDSNGDSGHWSSLALDTEGCPHIAYVSGNMYTGGTLLHAWKELSGWKNEIADSDGDTGWHPSLKLNSDGYPCVSYRKAYSHSNQMDLMFAYKDEGGWHVETVISGRSILKSSLDLDSNGHPCIAFTDTPSFSGVLGYVNFSGMVWSEEIIDSAGDTGWHPSLKLGHSSRAFISYSNDNLMIAIKNSEIFVPSMNFKGSVLLSMTLAFLMWFLLHQRS